MPTWTRARRSKWFVPEVDTALARALLGCVAPMLVPDILPLEFGSALLRKERKAEAVAGTASRAFAELRALRIDLRPHGPLLSRAVGTAARERHGLYDCLSLALAVELRLPLAAFDRRLATLATRLGIPLWSPDTP